MNNINEPSAALTALPNVEVFRRTDQGPELTPPTETPITVTLDQLLPYDQNPRKVRNPKFEEIKASIRERGLDAPPVVTQRPGESSFRIYSGGTTRLSILQELWSETRDERFFRIQCLFRPWPERGDIVVLTGHLAENDMRGHLTFIERALGVEDASALYEIECGKPLSQSELARRLTADGYPTLQSHVSRMREAVQYLLPCIPKLLFSGLGRHQVEKLAVLRKAGSRVWELHGKRRALDTDFTELFQEVLAQFDGELAGFAQQRFQDELIGRMSELLGVHYDTLHLDLNSNEARQAALDQEPDNEKPILSPVSTLTTHHHHEESGSLAKTAAAVHPPDTSGKTTTPPSHSPPAPTHSSIEQLVTTYTGTGRDVFETLWPIPAEIDQPKQLRELSTQMAFDLAGEKCKYMTRTEFGIGIECNSDASEDALLSFISSLSSASPPPLVGLLVGTSNPDKGIQRLTDPDLLKLFQLIRLARRLTELDNDSTY